MLSLERYRMLDLSRMLPGPFCSHLLADLGMQVIKVEEPEPRYGIGRDPFSHPDPTPEQEEWYAARNIAARNKKSIALNLVNPDIRPVPQDVFYRLVKDADVVLEGYRPGATTWMGVDYETIKKHNPKIIYCSISGYGQDGPYSKRPAHGGQFDAIGGVLPRDADGRPMSPGLAVGDMTASMYAALSIVSALLNREHTGEGQYIDVALASSALSMTMSSASMLLRGNESTERPRPVVRNPLGYIKCKDGKWITTGNLETIFWENFCKVLDHAEWIALRGAQTPEAEQMYQDIQNTFLTKTRDEWIDILVKAETVVAPVNDVADALQDPQMRHVGMAWDMPHPKYGTMTQLGFPVRFSNGAVQPGSFAPTLGQHTREVLREAGYTAEEIAEFERTGVVKTWTDAGWNK